MELTEHAVEQMTEGCTVAIAPAAAVVVVSVGPGRGSQRGERPVSAGRGQAGCS